MRRRDDGRRARAIWEVRDVYRVENAGLAYLLVAVLGMLLCLIGPFLR